MVAIYKVNLTEENRTKLHDMLKVGEHPARTIALGYLLLLTNQGKKIRRSLRPLR